MVGEIRATFTCDNTDFTFEGLDVEVLAANPFMEANDIAVRPTKREVLLGNCSIYTYGSKSLPSPFPTIRRAFILHAPPPSKTVWPGEFVEVRLTDNTSLIQSMHSSLALMHPARAISSHPSCGLSLVSFQVLPEPYVYLISQLSLVNCEAMKVWLIL